MTPSIRSYLSCDFVFTR